MSSHKIADREELTESLTDKLRSWMDEEGFDTQINFTLIPMDWDVRIDV